VPAFGDEQRHIVHLYPYHHWERSALRACRLVHAKDVLAGLGLFPKRVLAGIGVEVQFEVEISVLKIEPVQRTASCTAASRGCTVCSYPYRPFVEQLCSARPSGLCWWAIAYELGTGERRVPSVASEEASTRTATCILPCTAPFAIFAKKKFPLLAVGYMSSQ